MEKFIGYIWPPVACNDVAPPMTYVSQVFDLIQFLGNYVTKLSPTGYTLPAFPWFVYQSIGGAVATGSHGSSLKWGTLSNQVRTQKVLNIISVNLTLLTMYKHAAGMNLKKLPANKGYMII